MKDTPTTFQSGLTLKSFVVALLLTPINVYWIIELEVVRYTFPTWTHPLFNVIFILFLAPYNWARTWQNFPDADSFPARIFHRLFYVMYCHLSLFL